MSLAGDGDVLGAGENQLDRPSGNHRTQGGQDGPGGRLILLAPESPPHPPHIHFDLVEGDPQHPGRRLLHHGGRLGGAGDAHPAPFHGDGQGRLGLQVKMLLSPALGTPLDDMGARGPRRIDRTDFEGTGRGDQIAPPEGLTRIRDHGQRIIFENDF